MIEHCDDSREDRSIGRLAQKLNEAALAGQPWPAELSAAMASLRPQQLTQLVAATRVREQLVADTGPTLTQIVRRQLTGLSLDSKYTASQMLSALRLQFEWLVSRLDPVTQCRLRHVYQLQMQSPVLRDRMHRFFAVSYLPGRRMASFPEGERFTGLNHLTAVTLVPSYRHEGELRHLEFSFKLHAIEVDPDSGTVAVGGEEPGGRTRCLMAKLFNFVPFSGAKKDILPADSPLLGEGLAMHRAIEDAAVHAGSVQAVPQFPRIFLGFVDPDAMDSEVTLAAERETFQAVDRWFRGGRRLLNPFPGSNDDFVLPLLRHRVRSACRSWADVTRQTGPDDANFLMVCNRLVNTHAVGNLHLVPLDYFEPYSSQRPVRQSVQIYGQLPDYLRGRLAMKMVDGKPVEEHDLNLSHIQVVRMHEDDCITGGVAGVDFDFTTRPAVKRVSRSA